MAATTNPADKSFSVVIEHLLEKAMPGTPRPAHGTCACVCRTRSVDRTNIFVFARNRRDGWHDAIKHVVSSSMPVAAVKVTRAEYGRGTARPLEAHSPGGRRRATVQHVAIGIH